MPRPGSTAQRGYGWDHQQAAARLKAALRDGDPCARCGRPMYRANLAHIHADHVRTPLALGGHLPDALSHARCNLRHGAHLGQRLRRRTRRAGTPAARRTPLPTW